MTTRRPWVLGWPLLCLLLASCDCGSGESQKKDDKKSQDAGATADAVSGDTYRGDTTTADAATTPDRAPTTDRFVHDSTSPADSGLPDITVAQADSAGGDNSSGDSAPGPDTTVTVDAYANTPPQVEITAPVAGSLIKIGVPVQLQASVSDEQDGPLTGGVLTWVSDRDGALGTGSSLSVILLATGVHTLTLTARDSGGMSASDTVSVEAVVNLPPEVSITTPADGAYYHPTDQITFIGRARDYEDNMLLLDIAWYDGSTQLGTGSTLQTALSLGHHGITFEATDTDGATSRVSITVHVVTNIPPQCTITSPDPEEELTPGRASSFIAFCQDPDGTTLADHAYHWSSDLDGALGTGPLLYTTLTTPGTHSITLCASDSTNTNLEGCTSVTIQAINNRPPSCVITSPKDQDHLRFDQPITFVAEISDPEGDPVDVAWSSSISGLLSDQESFSRQLAPGAHQLTCAVFDHESAASNSRIQIHVDSPVAYIEQPADQSTVTAGSQIQFNGGGNDAEDGLLEGDTLIWSSSLDGEIGRGASFATSLTLGVHTIELQASDTDGNSGSDRIELNVSANQLPVVTIVSPQNSSTVGACTSVQLTCSAVDADQQPLQYQWSSSIDGTIAGTAETSWTPLTSGLHDLTCQATDSAQGQGQSSVEITIESPVASITDPATQTVVASGQALHFAGTGCDTEDGPLTGEQLSWSSDLQGALGTGTSLHLAAGLSPGLHTITLSASDIQSNSALASIQLRVNTPPQVSITSPPQGSQHPSSQELNCSGSATDVEDGNLDPTWWNSHQGDFGQGSSAVLSQPVVGKQQIRLSATDSDGETSAQQVEVFLQPASGGLFHSVPEASSDQITALTIDEVGRVLWVGTDSGLHRYHLDSGEMTGQAVPAAVSDDIRDIAIASDGTLWLATANGLATGCNPSDTSSCSAVFHHSDLSGLSSSVMQALVIMDDARTVLGTDNCLLFSDWSGPIHTAFCAGDGGGHGLPSGDIRDLLEDPTRDSIWVATSAGLSQMTPAALANMADANQTTFANWTTQSGLVSDDLRSLALASSNRVACGGADGVSIVDDSSGSVVLTTLDATAGVPGQVRDLTFAVATINGQQVEVLWVATGAGLLRLDLALPSSLLVDETDGLPSDNLHRVRVETTSQRKFLGTADGLDSYLGF